MVRESIDEVRGSDRVQIEWSDLPTHPLLETQYLLEPLKRVLPADVVHLHGTWSWGFIRVAAMLRRLKIPYVVRPFGTLDYWSMAQKGMKKKLAMALFMRRMLDGAAAIQALNAHERDSIERFGFRAPVRVVPNGVFLEEVAIETEPGLFRRSVPGLGDAPFLLFLSRLHYKKGLDILAEAWARFARDHPGVHMVVAGPDEDGSVRGFESAIDEAGLGGRVHLVGPVYGARKTAAFRECAAFVLPSRQEGFSVAVTEALGLGCAVVITEGCNFPEVADAEAGLITSLNAEEFAMAIARVMDDETLRAKMGENAARLVRDNYTWPKIGEQMVALYASVGAGGSGSV